MTTTEAINGAPTELPTGAERVPARGAGPQNGASTSVRYSCGGCETRWGGVSRAHCASCHQTFSGEGLFDRHRRDIGGIGTCVDPESLFSTNKITKEATREMYLTNGIWQSVEHPAPRGQHLRKSS